MSVSIYSKRLGINFCYLIQADGWIMYDTGPGFSVSEIVKWIESIPVELNEIQLIILSHGHFDHAGAATELKNITGAKIVIHEEDSEMFQNGQAELPTAVTTWGKITKAMMKPVMSIFKFDGSEADLIISDDGLSLEEYGIPGRIVHTPGHTPGSISVLLESGDAFVGCLTHNGPPFRLSPNHPIFAEDMASLWKSWNMLIEKGVKTIYPGHGQPFPVEEIIKVMPKSI